jgi:glycosyltransferase involved in cell wall biosynthesis
VKIVIPAPSELPARRANTVQVVQMAQALAELGHAVTVLVPTQSPLYRRQPPAWDEIAAYYGLHARFELRWLASRRWGRGYDFGWAAVRTARRLRADLLYARHPQAAALAAQLGLPTLFEAHDRPQGWAGPRLLRLFLRGRGARRLAVISRALAADLARDFGAPPVGEFTVIAPDAVDLTRYRDLPDPAAARAARPELGLAAASFVAGYTGSLYPGRGRELILDLARRLPAVEFLLVGGSPAEVAELRAAALPNLHLTGHLPHAAIPGCQAACDVLLAPYGQRIAASSGGDISRYLSPMKLFEYLASGRALLCSDLPVLREILTEAEAVLLPPEDAAAWADALAALRADPGRRAALGEAGRTAAARRSWTARARTLLAGLDGGQA